MQPVELAVAVGGARDGRQKAPLFVDAHRVGMNPGGAGDVRCTQYVISHYFFRRGKPEIIDPVGVLIRSFFSLR